MKKSKETILDPISGVELQEPKPEIKKPTISDSAERMLIRCGTQYEFRYVKGVRVPPGVAQVTGTATHKTVNLDLNFKKDKGEFSSSETIWQFNLVCFIVFFKSIF